MLPTLLAEGIPVGYAQETVAEKSVERVRFERIAGNPLEWLKVANRLRAGARAVQAAIEHDLNRMTFNDGDTFFEDEYPGSNMWDAYALLASFALENLLKGLRVKQSPGLVTDGHFKLKTHNLVKLATDAGLELNVIQAFHLFAATESAIWSAKYPTSLKSETQRVYTMVSGTGVFDTFEELYSLIEMRLAPNGSPRVEMQVIGNTLK